MKAIRSQSNSQPQKVRFVMFWHTSPNLLRGEIAGHVSQVPPGIFEAACEELNGIIAICA